VAIGERVWQIEKSRFRSTLADCTVTIHEHLDGRVAPLRTACGRAVRCSVPTDPPGSAEQASGRDGPTGESACGSKEAFDRHFPVSPSGGKPGAHRQLAGARAGESAGQKQSRSWWFRPVRRLIFLPDACVRLRDLQRRRPAGAQCWADW
jgi:hypothetical protein